MVKESSRRHSRGSSSQILRAALARVPHELCLRLRASHNTRPGAHWHPGELAGGRPINDWWLAFVRDGRVKVWNTDWSSTLGAGCLILVNHRVPFGMLNAGDSSPWVISARFGFYSLDDDRHVQPSEEGVFVVAHLCPQQHLERLLLDLNRVYTRPNELNPGAESSLLFVALQEVLRAAETESVVHANERVDAVIDRLWRHPEERLSLSDMAKMAGCSSNTLLRHFKTATQKTPVEYQIDVRCRCAAGLLTEESLTVVEIAMQLGYPDAYCFSRQFKKVFGTSPSEYRKRPLDTSVHNGDI